MRQLSLVLLIAGLVFFTNLNGGFLLDEDETKNAECTREMLSRGDWITPTFNEELRPDKPILLYWLMLTSYQLFGVGEFAARFWSATFGLGTVLVTYHLGKVLFSPKVGRWAGVIMGSTLMFTVAARAATPDSLLIFFSSLALLCYAASVKQYQPGRDTTSGKRTGENDQWLSVGGGLVSPSRGSWILVYAAIGFAVLAKGPVGLLLPACVIGLFALVMGIGSATVQPRESLPDGGWKALLRSGAHRFFNAVCYLRPIVAIQVVGLIALPWFIAVGLRTDGRWIEGFFLKHNVGRFLEPMEGHSGPLFLYYLAAIMIGLFPWSALFPAAVVSAVKKLRSSAQERPAFIFLFCWVGVYFTFFSFARTKLPSYILPMFPACALLTASFVCREGWDQFRERAYRLAFCSLFVVGLGILIATPFLAASLLAEPRVYALVGFIPLGGGLVGMIHLVLQERKGLPHVFAVTSFLFLIAIFGWVGPEVSKFQEGPQLAEVVRNRSTGSARVATFKYFSPSVVFYSRNRVDRLQTTEDISEWFEKPDSYLITMNKRMSRLSESLPPGIEILSRHRRFLKTDEVVLLGRRHTDELPGEPVVVGSKDPLSHR